MTLIDVPRGSGSAPGNSRRPRVVSAASQLGSPRGRSSGLPASDHAPDRHRCPETPPARSVLPGLPEIRLRLHRSSGSRAAPRAVVPLDPVAGPALTGLRIVRTRRARNARGKISVGAVPSGRWSTVTRERFEQMVADALDAIPPELGDAMENVVVVVEEWPTPEQLGASRTACCSVSTRACRSRRADRSRTPGVAPDRITVFSGSICRLAHDEERARGAASASPCCTRSATTSA